MKEEDKVRYIKIPKTGWEREMFWNELKSAFWWAVASCTLFTILVYLIVTHP